MSERSLIFAAEEFQRRTTCLQSEMALCGIDALLLTAPADIFYTTGFLTRFWESPARPWFVIVPSSGNPVAVIPSIGAPLMSRTWITDIRTWDAPDMTNTGMDLLAETLRELVPEHSSVRSTATGAIGLPMGFETHLHMPLGHYAELVEMLAPRKMKDATACVQRVREIKSEAEIDKIRDICAIAGLAFDQVPDFARAGRGLDAVFRDFQKACLEAGADWVSYVAGGAGTGGYGDVISPAETTPLQGGDILMLDTGAVRDGYFCDFDRNFAIGPANDAVKRGHDALWHATQDVLDTIEPGQRARDIHQSLCDALRQRSAEPAGGRFGHGLGITLTEWPSFNESDDTPLRAGMVLTLEPSVVIAPEKILVHEENIVLRDDGAELLSPRAPLTLPEIGK